MSDWAPGWYPCARCFCFPAERTVHKRPCRRAARILFGAVEISALPGLRVLRCRLGAMRALRALDLRPRYRVAHVAWVAHSS